MKKLAICSTSILLLLAAYAHAISSTPKSVNSGVSGIAALPNVNYHFMIIDIIGKQTDTAELAWEYHNQNYWSLIGTNNRPLNYNGPSNYLVLNFNSNGLNAIDSYPQGQMSYTIDGNPFTIAIPAFQFTMGVERFSLYIASDGSTYYGRQDHLPTSWGGNGETLMNQSLSMSPSEAFRPEHLAAAIPEPATLSLLCLGLIVLRRK